MSSAAVPDCSLCHGARWLVWPRPLWSTFLNNNQNLPGKSLISLNRHCESVLELTDEEWIALPAEIRRLEDALDRLFQPDSYNLMFLMNAVHHVHLHVVPRYEEPRTYGGERFHDPDYGSQSQTPARIMADGWLDSLADQIRAAAAAANPDTDR
jgi:diadenosine tetraphosphate (Ap4A) HIT family hydrolase